MRSASRSATNVKKICVTFVQSGVPTANIQCARNATVLMFAPSVEKLCATQRITFNARIHDEKNDALISWRLIFRKIGSITNISDISILSY